MSHFSMFVPIKANFKLANGKTGHAQGFRIILCCFNNCSNINPVVPVYYFPGQPSNTISPGALKFYAGFQKVTYEPLEHFEFFDPQHLSWRSPYKTKKNLDYIQIENFQNQPSKKQEYCCPNCLCPIKTKSLSDYLSAILSCLYCQAKMNGKKSTHGGSPKIYT